MAIWAIFLYSNSLKAEFFFDDFVNIVYNPLIQNLTSFNDLLNRYSSRILPYFSFALNYQFNGLDPFCYHLFNLIIHITNAVLVYFIVGKIYRTPALASREKQNVSLTALLCALLFLSHPLQTQAVSYIVQRITLLCTMFYLATVLLYLQARTTNNLRLYNWALVTTVLAMLTKEISWTLPFALLICELLFFEKDTKKMRRLIAFFSTLIIIPVLLIYSFSLRVDVAGLTKVADNISRSQYFLTEMSVITTYLRLLIIPIGQNADYDFPVISFPGNALTWFSFLVIGSLIYFAIRVRKNQPVFSFAILWFFLTLSIESSIIPINDVIAEHRLYLPMLGFVLCINELVLCFKKPLLSALTMAFLVAAFSFLTFERTLLWKDPAALWKDVIEKSPQKPRGYTNLGSTLLYRNKIDEAYFYLQKSIILGPSADAYLNLGSLELVRGNYHTALNNFENALKFSPQNVSGIYYNMGIAYKNINDLTKTQLYLEKSLALDPYQAHSQQVLIEVLYAQKKNDSALEWSQKFLPLQKNTATLRNIGAILTVNGQGKLAQRFYDKALSLKPKEADNWLELGKLYANYNQFDSAIKIWTQGEQINPRDARFQQLITQARKLKNQPSP